MRTRIWIGLVAVILTLASVGRSEPKGLADDGRVGVVADLQGTVLLRPAGRQRWSPAGARTVLLPGDQLRTLPRGANAAEVRLASGGSIVLGAGGLVRLEGRRKMRLARGDAEFAGTDAKPLTVTGPGGFERKVKKAVILRAKDKQTRRLEKTPRWLDGYRGSTTDEWMGSLVANVDGRNVALSIGYHKVNVVIRDQVAVTTIEESFVNSTSGRLEGTFSFPLPADASISGFGMWIGDELVEADIIERQRARQIYEDILRRKKDPGLLEWSGGNLFRASVFPIEPHSEKRIRIRYTQVLPMEGTRLRYRYALRSELLRLNPLRRLQIRVSHHSSAPIDTASSPTHDVTVSRTDHNATLEFSADEYTPDNDFEVVFGMKQTSPLRVVPHRRGEDGYFMLQFAPPDPGAGAWTRELVPEGTPLDLLFVVDTSGSMGPREREEQRTFLESTLALLGDADSFRILACDAEAVWLVEKPLEVNDKNVDKALDALAARRSLGWSDLDQGLGVAAAACTEQTHVIYIGDGIVTTADADPVALAQRLSGLRLPSGAAFHAVAPGSAYESGVLDAIANLGDGSARTTEGNPARAAHTLLTEIAQPPLTNLRIAFEGLRTARVYPERLPRIPAGTQQIALGRFLPEGDTAQSGKVTITGEREGKTVKFSADLTLAANEEGNSFLPRLWARKHLDALLAEGRTQAVKDEIVAFSERFGIMTPYTSFLVLESDEDRERYGVARRVHMRDGERFFADAKSAANTAALREQVKKARSWRLNLRGRMRAEISDLGRSLQHGAAYANFYPSSGGSGGGFYRGPMGESAGGGDGDWGVEEPVLKDAKSGDFNEADNDGEGDGAEDERFDDIPPDSREPSDPPPPPSKQPAPTSPAMESSRELGAKRRAPESFSRSRPGGAGRIHRFDRGLSRDKSESRRVQHSWAANLLVSPFPGLGAPPIQPPEQPEPAWDEDVKAILEGVSVPPAIEAGTEGGVQFSFTNRASGASPYAGFAHQHGSGVVADDRWFVSTGQLNVETVHHWLTETRGTLKTGSRLGRTRAGHESDRGTWAALSGRTGVDFRRSYFQWTAKIESRDGAVVVVRLVPPGGGHYTGSMLLTIDTEKQFVLQQDWHDGKTITSSRRREQLVEAGGLWWATVERTLDGDGNETWRRTLEVSEITDADVDAALADALTGHEDVIFLDAVDPSFDVAKQAAHDGEATFVHHLLLSSDHVSFQRWDAAWSEWNAARKLVGEKPGANWIELLLAQQGRRGEMYVGLVERMAAGLSETANGTTRALAWQLFNQTSGLQVNERLVVLDVLQKAGTAGAEGAELAWHQLQWDRQRANLLFSSNRPGEAVAIWRRLWNANKTDAQSALDLLRGLLRVSDLDGALALQTEFEAADFPRSEYRVQQFHAQLASALWNAMRFDELLPMTEKWIAANPKQAQPYQARLATLSAMGRIEESDAWVAQHLSTAQDLAGDPVLRGQLNAAVSVALGDEWNGGWYRGHVDPKWADKLAVVARALARDENADHSVAQRIITHHRYQNSAARAQLMKWLRADFVAAGAIEALSPDRVAAYQRWLPWDRNSVDAPIWRDATDRVLARWRAVQADTENNAELSAEQLAHRSTLFSVALSLLDVHQEREEAIALLRETLTTDPPVEVPQHAELLIHRLLTLPWTTELEDEILALVPRVLPPQAEDLQKTATLSWTIRWLTDRLVARRIEAELGPVEVRETWPRAELRSRHRTARANAREQLAARYASETSSTDDLRHPWYEIERICLLAQLGKDPKAVEGEAREMLLSTAAAPRDHGWILRERAILALSYIAVRPNADADLIARVDALFRERAKEAPESHDWNYVIFRLLIALDRPKDLEPLLRSWIVPADVDSGWRIALGYLMAEQERVDDAIQQFEHVAELGELGEDEFTTLADWYLVKGDEAARRRTLDRRYTVVPEHQLAQQLYTEYYRLQSNRGSTEAPPHMDDEILNVIRALLSKATRPDQQLHAVNNLYRHTKDFRLLAAIADGIVGHTPQQIYPFLQSAGGMIQNVHEEATCDEIRLRLQEREKTARTDTDRRAFALLLTQVERRAAEVLDQPGPHIQLALEQLQRARKGTWAPGERLLMANYLAALRRIPHQVLADEQMFQLKTLHEASEKGTTDRLRIAFARYRTGWSYHQRDRSVDGLTVALDTYRTAHDGVLPSTVNDVMDTLVQWHESMKRFARGEKLLLAEKERQTTVLQQEWYRHRLFRLHVSCLQSGGTISIGSGAPLFVASREQMKRALADDRPENIHAVFNLYCQLHLVAHRNAKIAKTGDDLLQFSRELFRELLPRFGNSQAQRVRQLAETVRAVDTPIKALTVLIEHLSIEPRWMSRTHNNGWSQYSHRVGEWTREANWQVGDLEPTLLGLVLREMERDLVTQQPHGRALYGNKGSSYFWNAKESEFLKVARRVISENPRSAHLLSHVAQYLWSDLDRYDEAIQVLLDADQNDALEEAGRWTLVTWMQQRKRWQDALPHAQRLVKERPDNLTYRIGTIRILHNVQQDDAGKALVDDSREHFDASKTARRMHYNIEAQLGDVSLECGYFLRAAELFEIAIPAHQRATRHHYPSGQGDGQLSNYYGSLARAYAGAQKYDEAVDAASAAIVIWSSHIYNRTQALNALKSVLKSIPDLPAWTHGYAKEAAETGLDAPVIRRALAQIHLERKEPDAALAHLRIALRLSPDDVHLHGEVIQAYTQKNDKAGLQAALRESLFQVPAQPELYVQLASSLRESGDAQGADRALSGLAEYAPNESAGHLQLAQILTRAGRHAEAAVQWKQVVRIRTLEPLGWLELARSQARAGDKEAARATLATLRTTDAGKGIDSAIDALAKEIERL